jgi:two-component system nitrogen regulation sensor histidine kinase GlnL
MLNPQLQKRLLDNLSTAVILLDDKLAITYLNPSAEVLFETSMKSIIEQKFDHIFYENENTEAELFRALKTGHPFTKREATIRSHTLSQNDGQLTVNYCVSVIQDPGERNFLLLEFQSLDRLLKINRDEALLNNQQATKALLRGMAHEVKNPLGGIKGAAQLLLRELKDSSQHEYIHVVIEEADRLKNLVDRMLGPRTIPDIKEQNIHEILEHVCHIINADSGHQVSIIKDYDPSIPDIWVDRDQMIQASLNILGNAHQALFESHTKNPKIIIRTRILRQFTIGAHHHRMVVKIDFIDNGPGVPEDIKETLFYPMISGRAQGTGLGLSIAQSILNQFDGLIECQSEVGETIFSILLPIRPKHEINLHRDNKHG